MDWIKYLNSSEKKQILIALAALAAVIGFLVFMFIALSPKEPITMEKALERSPEANRIDQMALELSRMTPAINYNTAGQDTSQYAIQNPVDGGFGDDGTYDSTVDVIKQNIEESNRLQQSVDLSNGVPASKYMSQEPQPQLAPADSLGSVQPSVIPTS